jgi:cytochrome c-type biogenesis protein CcmH/NrfG
VPLSEHEQQILDEIEQSLYQEDPRFARDTSRKLRSFNETALLRLGALAVVVGIVALVMFFVTSVVLVGLLAFVAMVGGIFAVASATHAILTRQKPSDRARQKLESILKKLETRFRDRYHRQ